MKHLFIGVEGTLGTVARVAMKLDPLPRTTVTALLGSPSVGAALEAIRLALDAETGQLRAAEALWQSCIRSAVACLSWSEPGFPLDDPICLLMEVGGPEEKPRRSLEGPVAAILERFPEVNGIIAGSKRQEAELWRLQEESDILYRSHPGAPTYDVCVPLSAIDAHVSVSSRALPPSSPASSHISTVIWPTANLQYRALPGRSVAGELRRRSGSRPLRGPPRHRRLLLGGTRRGIEADPFPAGDRRPDQAAAHRHAQARP